MDKKEIKKMNGHIQKFRQTYQKKPRYTYRELKRFYLEVSHLTLEDVEEVKFVSWLSFLESEGFLKGIKKSGEFKLRTGDVYFGEYYLKEKEIKAEVDVKQWFESSHSILQNQGEFYLKNETLFDEDFETLCLLNERLCQLDHNLKEKVTINQRSYQLFKSEKLLSGDEKGRTEKQEQQMYLVIKRLGLSGESHSLNYSIPIHYPVVVDFYQPNPTRRVLIVENQDPFYTLLELKQELKEFPFDGLVLGNGSEIESTFQHFEQGLFKGSFEQMDTVFYYAGDLDVYGLRIFNRLKDRYPQHRLVYLPTYLSSLLEKGKVVGSRLNTQGTPTSLDWEKWVTEQHESRWLGNHEDEIHQLLNEGKMIPQEVMTKKDWGVFLIQLKHEIEGEI